MKAKAKEKKASTNRKYPWKKIQEQRGNIQEQIAKFQEKRKASLLTPTRYYVQV